jgi:PAS domain S-box-containing protein
VETRGDFAALRLAAIVASSDDAIISKDLSGTIQTWNAAAERTFGYSAAEAVGRHITLIIPLDRRDEETEVISRIARGQSVEHFETIRQRKDGTLIEISLTVSPIRDEDGTIVGASKIARDITDQNRLRRQLEEANRLKDEFLATLSHELRTPLNAILGYSRMLRGKARDVERVERGLEIVERNATALNQLVSDILDMSRIISGKVRLNVQPCDLAAIAQNAIDAIMPAVEAKELRLDRILDPNATAVSGDPDRLQQVLWNLLSNAVKFTPRKGQIQVSLARVNSHVEFIVSDSGIGIAESFLPHLFEQFRQGDSGPTREFGGLGLGLALVRHFVELHGGTVHAASGGLGKGSTFRIELPIMASTRIPQPDGTVRVHPATGGTMPSARLSLAGITVLAVDNDPDSLLLVADVLREAGAFVVAAGSAAEAFERLAERSPDVIVADIEMPQMNGYEFIERLRSQPKDHGSLIPAAALTAYARAEDRTRSLLSGFQIHLAKPIEPGELLAAVGALAKRATY